MAQDLLGRICVVTGATGPVGAGVAAALLDQGATVVLPTRDAARAETLPASLGASDGRGLALVTDLADERGAARLRDAVLARFGRVDHVVASFGCPDPDARLVDLDLPSWRGVLAARVDAHFLTARAFLPRIRPGGTYTLLTGVEGAGLRAVAVGALHGLAAALRAETTSGHARFDEVRLGCPVDRSAPPGGIAGRRLGDLVVALATGAATPADVVTLGGEADVARLVERPRVAVRAGR